MYKRNRIHTKSTLATDGRKYHPPRGDYNEVITLYGLVGKTEVISVLMVYGLLRPLGGCLGWAGIFKPQGQFDVVS